MKNKCKPKRNGKKKKEKTKTNNRTKLNKKQKEEKKNDSNNIFPWASTISVLASIVYPCLLRQSSNTSRQDTGPTVGIVGTDHILTWPNSCVSVQFSCSVMSDSLQPREQQHARPPCPSPTPGVHSDSCPSIPAPKFYNCQSQTGLNLGSTPCPLPCSTDAVY